MAEIRLGHGQFSPGVGEVRDLHVDREIVGWVELRPHGRTVMLRHVGVWGNPDLAVRLGLRGTMSANAQGAGYVESPSFSGALDLAIAKLPSRA